MLSGSEAAPSIIEADIDADLQPEIILQNSELAAYVKPDLGGGVFELDYRPKRFNLLNVLGRRPEGYHGKLLEASRKQAGHGDGPVSIHDLNTVKSAGLEELLRYDRHPRLGFVEHFLPPATTLNDLASGRYEELGDFAGAPYDILDKGGAPKPRVLLRRKGLVGGREVTVDKTIWLDGNKLGCDYRISVNGGPLSFGFGCESALTLLAGDAPDRYYRIAGQDLGAAERKLVAVGESAATAPVELVNEWDRFVTRVAAPTANVIWRFPLETASQSEGGFERTYQASLIVPGLARCDAERRQAVRGPRRHRSGVAVARFTALV